MLAKLLRFAAPVVALALFAMAPPSASAAPISFSTTGAFTAGAGDSVVAGVLTTASGATLSYAGEPAGFADQTLLPVTGVGLGQFTFNLNSASGSFAPNDFFQLTITQSDPAGGPASSSASVTGTVTYVPGPSLDSGDLHVTFTTNPVIIGQVGYFLDPFDLTWTGTTPGQAVGTLRGTVAAVPLPATANMGIALLVCLAGAGVWRKVKSSQAVA